MPSPALIFDGDDTLWFVEQLYDEARDRAAEIVAREGLDAVTWSALQKTRDLENVRTLGLSATRFPQSSVEAYEEMAAAAGREIRQTVVSAVRRASERVFTTRAPLAPKVTDVLRELRPRFTIALLTKGDREVQERRVRDSGLARLFDRIEIVPEKTQETFAMLLDRIDAGPKGSWSIGNSLPSDINPALALGMSAIWIEAEVWAHEQREQTPGHGQLFVADDLAAVPGIVAAAEREP